MPRAAAPVAPPPGLEAPKDEMAPAKVKISSYSLPFAMSADPSQDFLDACYSMPRGNGLGEWVNAVIATAPYLDAQGLQQALSILDRAIGNVQQAKALDAIIANAMGGGSYPASHHVLNAELLRMQIYEQQQRLLQQLHLLKASLGVKDPAAMYTNTAGLPLPLQSAAGLAQPASLPSGFAPAEQMRRTSEYTAELLLGALGATAPEVSACPVPVVREAAQPQSASQNTKGAADRPAKAPVRQVETLSTSLQLLSSEDPDCLFIVRRINKLGFKAARKLKQHFSAYGSVVRVLVAHSTVRQHGDPQCHARRRPSSLGFVHMAFAKSVREILALGLEQEVDGSLIRVQRFERQHAAAAAAEEEAGEDHEEQGKEGWDRQQSAYSSASATTTASAMSSGSQSSDAGQDQEWR